MEDETFFLFFRARGIIHARVTGGHKRSQAGTHRPHTQEGSCQQSDQEKDASAGYVPLSTEEAHGGAVRRGVPRAFALASYPPVPSCNSSDRRHQLPASSLSHTSCQSCYHRPSHTITERTLPFARQAHAPCLKETGLLRTEAMTGPSGSRTRPAARRDGLALGAGAGGSPRRQ